MAAGFENSARRSTRQNEAFAVTTFSDIDTSMSNTVDLNTSSTTASVPHWWPA